MKIGTLSITVASVSAIINFVLAYIIGVHLLPTTYVGNKNHLAIVYHPFVSIIFGILFSIFFVKYLNKRIKRDFISRLLASSTLTSLIFGFLSLLILKLYSDFIKFLPYSGLLPLIEPEYTYSFLICTLAIFIPMIVYGNILNKKRR